MKARAKFALLVARLIKRVCCQTLGRCGAWTPNLSKRRPAMMTRNHFAALAVGLAVAAVASPAVAQRNATAWHKRIWSTFGVCNMTTFTGPAWLRNINRNERAKDFWIARN